MQTESKKNDKTIHSEWVFRCWHTMLDNAVFINSTNGPLRDHLWFCWKKIAFIVWDEMVPSVTFKFFELR